MRLERQLRDAALLEAGLEVAMESIATPAFILRGNTIASANSNGRAVFDAVPSLRRDLVEGTAAGFETTPLAVRGEPAARLAIQSAPGRDVRARVLTAARTWKLTRRQTQVLALIASADSNKVIAAKLGCALHTVEIHVAALFLKSGCASRAELVARLLRLE